MEITPWNRRKHQHKRTEYDLYEAIVATPIRARTALKKPSAFTSSPGHSEAKRACRTLYKSALVLESVGGSVSAKKRRTSEITSCTDMLPSTSMNSGGLLQEQRPDLHISVSGRGGSGDNEKLREGELYQQSSGQGKSRRWGTQHTWLGISVESDSVW